jgi:phosphoribosyl 1,2-cyclic phosphate phosphodiesterase
VLITHEHYDHVGGLDDLRPFCAFGSVPIYAEGYVADRLRTRMPYCFVEHRYPGVPDIPLRELVVGQSFRIGSTEVLPLRVTHGRLPILGYRIGPLGYITDMLTMPDESYQQLEGIELLIINALRLEPHPTHQTLEAAITAARRIGAKETYFIHASHHIGLHAELERSLPPHIHQAYDGEEIEV